MNTPTNVLKFGVKWILANAVAWYIGFGAHVIVRYSLVWSGLLSTSIAPVVQGVLIGTAIGLVQTILLRHQIGKVRWLMASIAGWTLGTIAAALAFQADPGNESYQFLGYVLWGTVGSFSATVSHCFLQRRHLCRNRWLLLLFIGSGAIGGFLGMHAMWTLERAFHYPDFRALRIPSVIVILATCGAVYGTVTTFPLFKLLPEIESETRNKTAVNQKRRLLFAIVLLEVASLTAMFLAILWSKQLPKPNRNALAVGELADLSTLKIEIHPPVELDFKPQEEILALRIEAAYQYPDLLSNEYEPSEAVFRKIEDGLPWWGIDGMFYYGAGEKSILGPSEESRFILNPYLLVAVEFEGLSVWRQGLSMWDSVRTSDVNLSSSDLPLYCPPESLQWYPSESRAEVTYNVSQYLEELNQWTDEQIALPADFSLLAYNARDMNLNHIYVSYKDSHNIQKYEPPNSSLRIEHYIHRGNSCGYPGGCNNASPRVHEISHIDIIELPAQAVVWLWKKKPILNRQHDMIWIIHFQ